MRHLPLILLAFFLNSANAEIRLASITGISASNLVANGANPSLKVWGGLGGAFSACGSADGTTPCDTCAALDGVPGDAAFDSVCNKKRIYDSLKIRFTFLSTSKAGTPIITYDTGSGQLPISSTPSTTVTPVPINQTVYLDVSWGDICALMTGAAGCDNIAVGTTENLTVNIGISGTDSTDLSDSEDDAISFTISAVQPSAAYGTAITTGTCGTDGGLCNFSLFQGDEKATIENITLSTTSSGVNLKFIQFYCSTIGFASITRGDTCTDPVEISGSSLERDTITGLQNGATYFFRAAAIDEAGNVGRAFRGDNTNCPNSTSNCHQVTPEDVLGLFNENSCFVATAAYGSPMEKNVKTLRRFRDQVLKKTSWGQIFIKTYYALSPSLARWIAQKSERRSAARILLTPIVFLVTAVVDYPWWTLFLIIFIFASFIWFQRKETSHGEKTV